jgi:hypothetical protein
MYELGIAGNSHLVVYCIPSAIACHLLSKFHYDVKKCWIANKWFWLGFFGSFPALVAFIAHIYFTKKKPA